MFWNRKPRAVTYNITVNSPFADQATGKKIVDAIREYEKGSGRGWRGPEGPTPGGVPRG